MTEDPYWNVNNMLYGNATSSVIRNVYYPAVVQSGNRFAYGMSNPIRWFDPWGLNDELLSDTLKNDYNNFIARNNMDIESALNEYYLAKNGLCDMSIEQAYSNYIMVYNMKMQEIDYYQSRIMEIDYVAAHSPFDVSYDIFDQGRISDSHDKVLWLAEMLVEVGRAELAILPVPHYVKNDKESNLCWAKELSGIESFYKYDDYDRSMEKAKLAHGEYNYNNGLPLSRFRDYADFYIGDTIKLYPNHYNDYLDQMLIELYNKHPILLNAGVLLFDENGHALTLVGMVKVRDTNQVGVFFNDSNEINGISYHSWKDLQRNNMIAGELTLYSMNFTAPNKM